MIRIGYGVNPIGSNGNQPRDRIVFADAKGFPLYSWSKDTVPGKSACDAECSKTWLPATAPADAKPVGLWTVVARDDGSKQWAFRGQPMYTYVDEKKATPPPVAPGAVANTNPISPNAAPVPAAARRRWQTRHKPTGAAANSDAGGALPQPWAVRAAKAVAMNSTAMKLSN